MLARAHAVGRKLHRARLPSRRNATIISSFHQELMCTTLAVVTTTVHLLAVVHGVGATLPAAGAPTFSLVGCKILTSLV